MGYANPQQSVTYTWPSHDFGAGAGAVSFQGPKGLQGRIKEIYVHSTETFSNTTTPAYVRVGTSGDADAYAEANLGTTAATDCFVGSTDDADWIIAGDLAVDTQIEVTFIAPTGGTPAGIGVVQIVVDWF